MIIREMVEANKKRLLALAERLWQSLGYEQRVLIATAEKYNVLTTNRVDDYEVHIMFDGQKPTLVAGSAINKKEARGIMLYIFQLSKRGN